MSEDFDWQPPEHYNFARDCFHRHAQETPDAAALLWVGPDGAQRTFSFAELDARAARAARVMHQAGVRAGDTVLILMGRERPWWELMLACLRLGAIASPGTVQLMPKDIRYRAEAAHARCIITDAELAERTDRALAGQQGAGEIARITLGGERDGWVHYDSAMRAAEPLPDFADTAADTPIMCYFTSGTTGQPKMTLHGAIYPLAHHITAQYWLGLEPGDIMWNLSDTGWAKAAWSSLFAPWLKGATIMAFHSPGFDAEAVLDLLDKHRVTTLCAPPTAYRIFVRSPALAGRKFSGLKRCVSAGEPLNPEVMDLWREATGQTIYDGYGQTETVLLCCNRPGAEKQGAMGMPLPAINLSVIGHEGEILPAGAEGDIALNLAKGRPPGLFLGYRDDPGRTAATRRGDWYLTGDRAICDADGFFHFVGRADDVILTSGYRIGPFEVESALFEHPAVAESAVIASPDPVRGEVVKALVVLAKGHEPSDELAAALQEHVKSVTAPYKYPRKIAFVESLPKTISGKIRRKQLREEEWRREQV